MACSGTALLYNISTCLNLPLCPACIRHTLAARTSSNSETFDSERGKEPSLLAGRHNQWTTTHLGQSTAAVPIILTCSNVPAGYRTQPLCVWLQLLQNKERVVYSFFGFLFNSLAWYQKGKVMLQVETRCVCHTSVSLNSQNVSINEVPREYWHLREREV
jgi:hypothetical protein